MPNGRSFPSTADCGRRPVALETDDGAEDDDGRIGKTNGGFGGGGFGRGDGCGVETGIASGRRLSIVVGMDMFCVLSSETRGAGGSEAS